MMLVLEARAMITHLSHYFNSLAALSFYCILVSQLCLTQTLTHQNPLKQRFQRALHESFISILN